MAFTFTLHDFDPNKIPEYEKELKVERLQKIMSNVENVYHFATYKMMEDFNQKLDVLDKEIEEIRQDFKKIPLDEDGQENFEHMNLTSDINMRIDEKIWIKEQLLALKEMQIVHRYKEIEIALKLLFITAFDDASTYSMFQWDKMKKAYQSKNIVLESLLGFIEVDQLRLVNNNIKHDMLISQDVANIPEFNNQKYFDFNNLTKFYHRTGDEFTIFLGKVYKQLESIVYA